jgi:hypothetical protein
VNNPLNLKKIVSGSVSFDLAVDKTLSRLWQLVCGAGQGPPSMTHPRRQSVRGKQAVQDWQINITQ